MSYRTAALDTDRMPPGIPFIIGNEAAERFSFYGMRTILVVFMTKYLWLMDQQAGTAMSQAEAVEHYHSFTGWVYFTPLIGALLADIFLGKYRTIILLSLVYCLGHATLAFMGHAGNSGWWLFAGLMLICIGSGGIKPCVSAHVGDQFGPKNSHLLSRIYNWFYFSINLGSTVSTILTPWLLEWYGPHWAFGVPGVLMAIATVMFWMGRNRFVHIPPSGSGFVKDFFSREGLVALAKLIPLFVFIAFFWALYDQTGSSWVFQAEQMDRKFLGITWLESQVQAINPILILTFIPLFTFVLYPVMDRVFKLTPLRKIGIGFFLMVATFGLSTLSQSWIDSGKFPSIGWQFLAFVLITASEIMVSIVGLEFAYTQAPKSMKSLIMSLYLLSVWLGNIFTAQINHYIQIPSAAEEQLAVAVASLEKDWQKDPRNVVLPGFSASDDSDNMVAHLKGGAIEKLDLPGNESFTAAAAVIEAAARKNNDQLPEADKLGADLGKDIFGSPIRYEIIDSTHFRLISDGADHKPGSKWNMGLTVTVQKPEPPGSGESWLEKRKAQLGIATVNTSTETRYSASAFCGGQTKLEGAAYFRFFTWLMLGAAVVYVPFALAYRPRTYLHD
ncbi:POT family MFS transporter [Luteolibacter soli]|uniref:POT family MFS transporter n=1 Tax=Luteolibacter soli TaxID=3135280 RepID=A0ABU9AMV9_9BACT